MHLPTASCKHFDMSQHITLVPLFRESEVDSYFDAFERIAATLRWSKDVWSALFQCKLVEKAQELSTSLTINQSLDYDIVKATVLQAYELPHKPYELSCCLYLWCTASEVPNFALSLKIACPKKICIFE